MEISYLGGDAFVLKGDQTVVINPPQAAAKSDIVLHSRRRNDRTYIVDGPGEYEIKGVLIATVESTAGDREALAHAVELGGLNVLHVAGCDDRLAGRESDTLGRVDVLLVNVKDVRATEAVVRDLEPRVVIPYGKHASDLCGSLGSSQVTEETRFSWNGTGTPPKVMMLRPSAKRRAA